MGGLTDKSKGKAKEIGGVVTNDRELEAEGKRDRTKGEVKEGFEEAKQGIKDAFNRDNEPSRH